jgi:translation initiation factor IF-1
MKAISYSLSYSNAMFQVELENGHQVLAHISGKLRMIIIAEKGSKRKIAT